MSAEVADSTTKSHLIGKFSKDERLSLGRGDEMLSQVGLLREASSLTTHRAGWYPQIYLGKTGPQLKNCQRRDPGWDLKTLVGK